MKSQTLTMTLAAQTLANPLWNSVVNRDINADGTFYYAVKTTGVYCRPSCGSRTPCPENVQFHLTCKEAEAAGFRACKRCKPDQPLLAAQHAATIAAVCKLIETSEALPTLSALAEHAGLSVYYFHRVFKSVTGLTPKAYSTAHRAGPTGYAVS